MRLLLKMSKFDRFWTGAVLGVHNLHWLTLTPVMIKGWEISSENRVVRVLFWIVKSQKGHLNYDKLRHFIYFCRRLFLELIALVSTSWSQRELLNDHKPKRLRAGQMRLSEVVMILISYHQSGARVWHIFTLIYTLKVAICFHISWAILSLSPWSPISRKEWKTGSCHDKTRPSLLRRSFLPSSHWASLPHQCVRSPLSRSHQLSTQRRQTDPPSLNITGVN